MKKTLAKSLALAFVGSLLVAGSAMALPYNNAGSRPINPLPTTAPVGNTVQSILDSKAGVGLLNAVTSQDVDAVWTQTDVAGTSTVFELDYYTQAPTGTAAVGIFDYNTGEKFTFDGTYGASWDIDNPHNGQSVSFRFVDGDLKAGNTVLETGGWTGVFGLYWTTGNDTSYTLDTKNADGAARALVYGLPNGVMSSNGNDDWLVFFDDNADNAIDFNDAIVLLKDASPVPEPATMLLLGTGLIGLASARRKAKKA